MGTRGPNKVPTKRLADRGSWLAKTRKGEPDPQGIPIKPAGLTGKALKLFNQKRDQLLAMGVIGESDDIALARYCIFWEMFLETTAKNVHDRVKISGELAKLESKFGLTPSDRASMVVDQPDKEDKYFGKSG